MCVCVCVHVCVCVCVCSVCVCVCVYMCVYVYVHVYVCVCICMCMCVCMCVCLCSTSFSSRWYNTFCVHVGVCVCNMCVWVWVWVYAYVCIMLLLLPVPGGPPLWSLWLLLRDRLDGECLSLHLYQQTTIASNVSVAVHSESQAPIQLRYLAAAQATAITSSGPSYWYWFGENTTLLQVDLRLLSDEGSLMAYAGESD